MTAIKLATIATDRRDGIVEMLESALVEAKAGQLDCAFLVAERVGESVMSWWESGTGDLATTIGKLRMLEFRLMRALEEQEIVK